MKVAFFALSMVVSQMAFAGEVKLTAGGSIDLNGMKVTCEGSAQTKPSCMVIKENGTYSVYMGAVRIDSGLSYGAAMGTMQSYQSNGTCN